MGLQPIGCPALIALRPLSAGISPYGRHALSSQCPDSPLMGSQAYPDLGTAPGVQRSFSPAALAESGDFVAGPVVRFLVAPCSFVRAACLVRPPHFPTHRPDWRKLEARRWLRFRDLRQPPWFRSPRVTGTAAIALDTWQSPRYPLFKLRKPYELSSPILPRP